MPPFKKPEVTQEMPPEKANARKVVNRVGPSIVDRPTPVLRESVAEPSLDNCVVCVYGSKGVGKTTMACKWPKPALVMWEPHRHNMTGVVQVPSKGCGFCGGKNKRCFACDGTGQERPLDCERADLYLTQLIDNPKFETIVQDTADRWYQAVLESVCTAKGVEHPSEVNDYGKTWNDVAIGFQQRIGRVIAADKTLIFVAHERLREETPTYGDVTEKIKPRASNACLEIIKACAEVVLHYGYDGPHWCVTVRGGSSVLTSVGWTKRFVDAKGRPLSRFWVSEDPDVAYKELRMAFDGTLKKNTFTVEEEIDKADAAAKKAATKDK